MTTKPEHRALVTDHAIVRWLERVEGYNFDDIRKKFRRRRGESIDTYILRDLARKYGLFRGNIIYKIVTKQVRNAIKMEAKKIHRGDQTLVISGGQVVTLMKRKR